MTDKPKKAADSELDQRAKQLAKELLDALQNPDPVREAERAAFEEQKAKDDEASILAYHARRKAKIAAKAAVEVSGKKISGRPRSLAEMDFVAGMYPCEACGDRQPLAWKTGGSPPVWTVRADCPRCATPRMYVFDSDDDLIEAEHPDLELGGPEPSAILDPLALLGEIDRLTPTISNRADLAGSDRELNWDRIERVQTALHELAKFAPGDSAEIPRSALRTDEAVADQRARPERYTRAWVARELAHWDEVSRALIATRPEQLPMSEKRGSLDPKALEAHRLWVLNGRKGAGALDVVGVDVTNGRLDGLVLTGARLERVTFVGANLTYTSLDASELLGCEFNDARISSVRLTGSILADCIFENVQGGMTDYVGAKISACSFVRAGLDGSWWKQATVDRSQFMAVRFSNAQFDGARFTECDFREASFKPLTPLPLPSMKGATFENCDFRDVDLTGAHLSGATFRACKFGDAHGKPASADNVMVVDADFSEAGDGSDIGTLKDLLEQLSR